MIIISESRWEWKKNPSNLNCDGKTVSDQIAMEKPLVKRGRVPKSQQNTTKRTPPCAYFLRCTLLLYCKCYLWNMPFTDGVCYNTVQYNMIWYTTPQCITLTSQWALWPLKSPVYLVFVNRMFRRTSKKTSKLCVTGLCEGIHRWLTIKKGM